MTLCGQSTLRVLFLSRVFVPHRWKRWIVGMSLPSPFGILELLQKFCFFASVASKAKIPMKDKLKRRNYTSRSRCSMCLEEEESVDHLLMHCRWASSLWDLSLSLMGASWVQPPIGEM